MSNPSATTLVPNILENDPTLLPIASYMAGLPVEQIIKTRPSPSGGIVVIDLVGNKRTYPAGQYQQALVESGNGILRNARGKFVSQEQQDADHRLELRKPAKRRKQSHAE